jgi:hypothetical protein
MCETNTSNSGVTRASGIVLKTYIPLFAVLITALVSIFTVVFGNYLEKENERVFEMKKIEKDLYSRLIINVVRKKSLIDEIPKAEVDYTIKNNEWDALYKKYPDLKNNILEMTEIMGTLAIYGNDEAIRAYKQLNLDSGVKNNLSVATPQAKWILSLRKTVQPETTLTAAEINWTGAR